MNSIACRHCNLIVNVRPMNKGLCQSIPHSFIEFQFVTGPRMASLDLTRSDNGSTLRAAGYSLTNHFHAPNSDTLCCFLTAPSARNTKRASSRRKSRVPSPRDDLRAWYTIDEIIPLPNAPAAESRHPMCHFHFAINLHPTTEQPAAKCIFTFGFNTPSYCGLCVVGPAGKIS